MADESDLTLGDGGEDKKGVFVIINQVTHNLHYPDLNDRDWSGVRPFNYDSDVRRILDTFNLKSDSQNLIMETDLTNKSGGNSFNAFMSKRVLKYNKKPSFLFFFLVSHGFRDGIFLLSTKKARTRPPCCRKVPNHTHQGKCHSRHIIRDVIDRVAACSIYDNIPKIFVMQMCRGANKAVVKIGDGDSEAMSYSLENDLFIPKYPDIFLFRACLEGYSCWATKLPTKNCQHCKQVNNQSCSECMKLKNKGSLLVRSLCESVNELSRARSQREAVINELYSPQQNDSQKAAYEYLTSQLRAEDMIDGWITGVGQRTTAKVANHLTTADGVPKDKQQIHINSTLSKKLSFIRILKTQGVMMEGPQV